jgi:hypothetical protein
LASIAFYGVAGILFLVLTFISGFPPHLAVLGIVSLVAAYGLFAGRKWAVWLVAALLLIGTTFSVATLYYVASVDALTTAGMVVYLVLTWIFAIVVIRARKYE